MGKMMTNFGTLEDVQTWLDLTTLCQAATVHCRTKKSVFLLAKNTTGLPIGFYLKSHPETRAEILPAGSLRALAASSVPAPLQRAPSAPPSQHLPSEAVKGPTGTEMMKLGALLARVSLQARKDPKALRSTCFRNHLGQTIKQLQSNTPLVPQPSCSNLSTCGFCSIFGFCWRNARAVLPFLSYARAMTQGHHTAIGRVCNIQFKCGQIARDPQFANLINEHETVRLYAEWFPSMVSSHFRTVHCSCWRSHHQVTSKPSIFF